MVDFTCISWQTHYGLIGGQNYSQIPQSCLERFPDYYFHEVPIKIGTIMVLVATFLKLLFVMGFLITVNLSLTDTVIGGSDAHFYTNKVKSKYITVESEI